MNRIYLLLLFLSSAFLLLVGCKSVEPLLKPYVVPAEQLKEPALFYYNLPLTVLEFEITVKQVQSFRGPYYQYGEKYLGLDKNSIVQLNTKENFIEKISSRTFSVPDSSQWYAFVHNENTPPAFFLNSESILLSFNSELFAPTDKKYLPTVQHPVPVDLEEYFYDLSMVSMVGEELRTTLQHVKKDTTTVRVPVRENVRVQKNTEELARLAAEFIQKVRNLRFELVAGLYESFPEGKSLQTSIEELYHVEQRYMQLFTGYTKDTSYTYHLYAIPDNNNETYTKVLCYFSAEEGLTLINPKIPYRNNNRNQHLIVEVSSPDSPIKPSLQFPGGLVYRVPAVCKVELFLGTKMLYSSQHPVNQRGKILQIPYDISRNPEIKINMDEHSGAVRYFMMPQPKNPKKK